MVEPKEYKKSIKPVERTSNSYAPTACRICGFSSVQIGDIGEVSCNSRSAYSSKYGQVYGLFHTLCLSHFPDKLDAIAKQDKVNFLKRRILETHSIDYMKDANGEYLFDNHGFVKLTLANRAAYEAELKSLEAGE